MVLPVAQPMSLRFMNGSVCTMLNIEVSGGMLVSPELSPLELEHYSRHLKLPGFGLEKQLALRDARVLLVGAGGLGCPVGLYLAAAGVGVIGVVDFDRVERSNLQRQVAHRADRLGQPKVDSLIESMRGVNPLLHYVPHHCRLSEENIQALIADYDLIIDGSDNYATRFLLADACYLGGKPLLHGAVYQYDAQISLFLPGQTACYRCVFREPPAQGALASCADVGVLGVMPGTVGLMMATEAIKFLTALPVPSQGKLLLYDALQQSLRHLALTPDADCPLCGPNASIQAPRELKLVCGNTVGPDWEINAQQAATLLEQGAILLDVRESFEFQGGHIPQACHLPLGRVADGIADLHPGGAGAVESLSIVAYCQRGQRSLEAVRQLRALGYAQSYSLRGGIAAWEGPVILPV